MKRFFAAGLLLAGVATANTSSAAEDDVNRPVQKVLKLLGEMKVTLEKEQKSDIELFEKMDCWCTTNREQKTAAVEAAEKKIADLKAAIEEYTARSAELDTQIKNLKADIAKNQEALAEATALREKENSEFSAEEAQMVETIDSLGKAVEALGGVHASFAQKKVALMQVQDSVSKPMYASSKYADVMRKDLWSVLGAFNEEASAAAPEISATQVFSEMFSAPKAFLSVAQPTATGTDGNSYEAASGENGKDALYSAGAGMGQGKGLLSGADGKAYDEARQSKSDAAYKAKHLQGGGVKGAKSYNAQSGAIYGILQQMHEDFTTKLGNARTEEAAALKAFLAMKKALLAEIAAQETAVKDKKAEMADTNQKNAQAKKDVEDTTNALTADQQFLVNMEEQCASSKDEHDARVKERQDEIVAVGEAMGILTNDESRDLFTRTMGFVQINASVKESSTHRLRSRAAKMILRSAKKSGNYQLAALAVSVQLDAFTKVKKAMDNMLAELKKQQAAEYEKKEFCNKELDTNEDDISDKTKFSADTQSTITDLAGQIDSLKKQIEVLELDIHNSQVSIKKAGEDRAAENKEFQTTVNDQRMTVTILGKALDRLKAFYEQKASLLQQPSTLERMRGERDGTAGYSVAGKAPTQANYKQNAKSPGAMGLLELIIADAKQMEKEALRDEQDSQTNYAKFVTDANTSVRNAQTQVESATVTKAKASAEKAEQEATLSDTEKILATLKSENANLHQQCDFTMKNYGVTQEARAQEMESIAQAKAVLSGADFSF